MSSVPTEPIRSGSCVSFRLGDAICPAFAQVASQMSPDVTVCGEVAFFSDRGGDKGHFAIITVEGLATPLIVPVSKLSLFFAAHSARVAEAQARANRQRARRPQLPGGRREAG